MTSQTLPPEAASYLAALETAAAELPPNVRDELLADIRAHLVDALAADRPIREVLRSLGPVDQVTADVRESLGLDSDPGFGWRAAEAAAAEAQARKVSRSRTGLVVASAGVGLMTAILLSFVTPWFTMESEWEPERRLAEPFGLLLTAMALLPALLVAAPLLFPQRRRGTATLVAAGLVTLAALASGLTPALPGVPALWLPMVMLAWCCAVVPWRVRLRAGQRPHPAARVAGAVVLALPVVPALIGLVSGSVRFEASAPLWIAAILVLAGLYGVGIRVVRLVVALVGAVMLIGTAMLGPIGSPLLWLLGGVWLTLGLGALASGDWRLRHR